MHHSERKHSKFSASGAERWINCSGSVALSEGVPSKDSIWSIEGTKAHEVLELILKSYIDGFGERVQNFTEEMVSFGTHAATFIFNLHKKLVYSEILVETRISLPFIHAEMFGTFDGAVLDHFGTLHVFDYKYGAGHAVSPKENLQMIFYGMGLAHKYDWNFKKIRLWIIQPRIKGYDGPTFWEISIEEMKFYVDVFKKAVYRVNKFPDKYTEGSWCHWCSAKGICPLKADKKLDKAINVFKKLPL